MVTLAHSDEHGLWMHYATFEGPDEDSPDVTLIPMIHVGNRDFYREAHEETWRYDFALYEGAYVPMKSVFRHIYPFLAKAVGLTPQGSGNVSLKRQGWKKAHENAPRERIMVKSINTSHLKLSRRQKQIIADMDRKEFSQAIKDMPLSAKLAFPFILIALLVIAPFAIKREDFFDLPEDDNDDDKAGFFERCMRHYFKYALDDRDEFLKYVLRNGIETCQGHDLSLCVQYGQKHMKSLVAFLTEEMNYTQEYTRKVLAVSRTKNMSLKGIDTGYGEAYAAYKFLPSNMSDDHQKYDRKMTSTETRKAAWDKVSKQKERKSVQAAYPFSREKIMKAWADCNHSTSNYRFPLGGEMSSSDVELQVDYSDEIETYSIDTEYVKPTYSFSPSQLSGSLKNPKIIDEALVFKVKPKSDAA